MVAKNREIFRLTIGSLSPAQLQWIRDTLARYPYYQEARLRLVKELHHLGDLTWRDELRLLALQTCDRNMLFKCFEPGADSGPEQSDIHGNQQVINSETEPAKVHANRMAEAGIHGMGNTGAKGRQLEIIEKFLKKQPGMPPANAAYTLEKQPTMDNSLLVPEDLVSETLAKIYAKQGKWEQAIKVYERLIHQVPEKKAKFAAQILELQHNLR
ncbi:MAG: tetratricopeptide repeat-containing protein [Bacteroidetes bacterium]|jgi:tetratricopeptide (TPR) repeat protein|nr:tetratricopeptide repeat-containing protein [Bacteroidota bacterium]